MKNFFLILIAVFLISACGEKPTAAPATGTPKPPSTVVPPTLISAAQPLPTVTPVCISSEPTQKDIGRTLSYADDIFSELEWEKSYAVTEDRVSVTRLNNPQGAIVYLEMIIFPCSYEEPDLNRYYSDENWKSIFQNYESYELLDECKTNDGLRLYEFKTLNFGYEYRVRYWVENDTDTSIISTMVAFPLDSKALLDDYSSRLFPKYAACP
jgi:hypothetical protein